jgi:hypothetical protein
MEAGVSGNDHDAVFAAAMEKRQTQSVKLPTMSGIAPSAYITAMVSTSSCCLTGSRIADWVFLQTLSPGVLLLPTTRNRSF